MDPWISPDRFDEVRDETIWREATEEERAGLRERIASRG
jgi:hypothetical protein